MTGPDATKHAPFEIQWWAVAFIDLLGQKDAFLKTDHIPDAADREGQAALRQAITDSLGVITRLHGLLDVFTEDCPNDSAVNRRHRLQHLRWSDGVVLYCSLADGPGHEPIEGLRHLLATVSALMLLQLQLGKPLRGGIDVGTGVETEGQLFGAALVKAYVLESSCAGHPRIVVGESVVRAIDEFRAIPTAAAAAERLRGVVIRDEDYHWILDYAGAATHNLFPGEDVGPAIQDARQFGARERERHQRDGDLKLFERYSKLMRYLDSRAPAQEGRDPS